SDESDEEEDDPSCPTIRIPLEDKIRVRRTFHNAVIINILGRSFPFTYIYEQKDTSIMGSQRGSSGLRHRMGLLRCSFRDCLRSRKSHVWGSLDGGRSLCCSSKLEIAFPTSRFVSVKSQSLGPPSRPSLGIFRCSDPLDHWR
ncbi:hypothetical protein LINPERPRIM_LOCUS5395, partial [Linum perenne]